MKRVHTLISSGVLLILFIFFLFSCATVSNTGIDASVASGSFTQALQAIDNERTARGSVYSDKNNEILFYLDRGMVNHYAGRYAESVKDLEEAERLIEEAFTKSLTQEITSYIANDNSKDYSGEDYEDLYINVFNALNYYHLNDIEGALVEIRRVNEKLSFLANKYERASEKVLSATSDLAGANLGVEAVKFSNSALARYLSLLFFRAKGSDDDVRIDMEELRRAYELAPAVYNNSLPSSIDEERSVPQGMARLNVIGFTGLSPVKEEQEINIPLPLLPPLTLALPKMVDRPTNIESIEVILDTGQQFKLELLEDMNNVASETFKGKYGLTVAKTAARTLIKTAASAGAAKLAERSPGGALAGFAVGIAGKVATDMSEKADLRMSRYFPGRSYVGGINLEPGTYSITVNYYGSGGRLIATDRQDNVPVEGNKLNLAQFVNFGQTSSASPPPANVASGRSPSAVTAARPRSPAGAASVAGSSAAAPTPPQPASTPAPVPVPVSASTQEKPRLGILPFTGGSVGDGEALAVLFSIQDDLRGAFTIVPLTSEVNTAVAERSFQASRNIDSDTIVRLGRMLDVDYVISGHFRPLGDSNLVVATIVKVETFELMAGDYRQYNSIEDIPAMLPSIARNIAINAKRDSLRLRTLAIAPSREAVTDDAQALAQVLSIAVANTGKYAVLLRTSASNADYVLSTDARDMGNVNMLIAQILDAENGEEFAEESLDYRLIGDVIAQMPQFAAALTGTKVATAALTGTKVATATLTGSGEAVSEVAVEQPPKRNLFSDDADASWKNKWIYLGGSLGFGSYSWTGTFWNGNSYEWDSSKETAFLFAPALIADFALLPFFSIESGFALWLGGGTAYLVMPLMGKLGGRIAQVELSFDAGYAIGMGLAFGGTFGFHAGPGILFAKFLSVPNASPPGGIDLDSTWQLSVGYKIGIIDKRSKSQETNN